MKLAVVFASLLVAASARAQNAEHLLDEVTVQRAAVRLSDLLPPGAPPDFRLQAEGIVLARAPEAGSVRVFNAADIREALPGSSEFVVPDQVIVRSAGWPIAIASVKQALAASELASGWDLTEAIIVTPAGYVSRIPQIGLEVIRIGEAPEGHALSAEMRCVERSACGTFWIRILMRSAAPSDRKPRAVAATRVPPLVSDWPSSQAVGRRPLLVQPGRRAMLVIEADGLRISEPVLPQKSGRLGDIIRVIDPVSHKSLRAEVSAAGVLRPEEAARAERLEKTK